MAWYSSWYRRRSSSYRRPVDNTPKLNDFENSYSDNRWITRIRSYSISRWAPWSVRSKLGSQVYREQRQLNDDSGAVTITNASAYGKRGEQVKELLESKGKSDAYYVYGKGYMAIDNDVAVAIESRGWKRGEAYSKVRREFGLGAAKWYHAKQNRDYYLELAEKYADSSISWQRRSASYYQRRADRYKPIDNGDGTFEIQGEGLVDPPERQPIISIKKRTTYTTEVETESSTLVADYTLDEKTTNRYRNNIKETYTDGELTNQEITKDLLYSRDGGSRLSVKDNSLYRPTSTYEYTQTKGYAGDISGTQDKLTYAWGRYSRYMGGFYGYVNNTGAVAHRGYTVDGDVDVQTTAINNFGSGRSYTYANGAYNSWLIGKDNSDTTINIGARAEGAHSFSWSWRYYQDARATGVGYSRLATGSGDDTITINAEAELNGLNRGYVRGYKDRATAYGTNRASIVTGDGDDTLTIKARAFSNVGQGRYFSEVGIQSTKIEMGAGDDELTIDTITGQSARDSLIDMGEGDDILTLGGRFDKLADRNVFKGGDGFDTLVFNNLSNTDFNALTRQSFTFTPDKVTLGSTTFEGFEQVQIGDNISFKPSEITSTTQFTDIIKPEVFV